MTCRARRTGRIPRAVSQLAALYERVVRETLAYVDREMTHPEGVLQFPGRRVEGEEGKFFVWRRDEVLELSGRELGPALCDAYGVTPRGNFEKGASVLHAAMRLEACATKRGLSAEEAEAGGWRRPGRLLFRSAGAASEARPGRKGDRRLERAS